MPNLVCFISNLPFLPIPDLQMAIHIANPMDFPRVNFAELMLY